MKLISGAVLRLLHATDKERKQCMRRPKIPGTRRPTQAPHWPRPCMSPTRARIDLVMTMPLRIAC
jgi:hypothetical protein